MLKKAVDKNVFSNEFTNDNGVKPPEDILRLLTSIERDVNDTTTSINIADYIRKFMSTYYIHNRVGTPLKTSEIPNIKTGGVREFRRGQIIVKQNTSSINTFVLYISNEDSHTARIMTRDNIDPKNYNIIEEIVPITSLSEYSIVEPIQQDFKMEQSNLNEESLLEVYNIA